MMKEKKLSWEELEAKAIYTPEIEDEYIQKKNKKQKALPKNQNKNQQTTKLIISKKQQKK